ncbi:hypothetical protein EUGRSUZ_A01087 [Eucalyptus grandis]|uniref:Uncharacterized protein n=2 Tax=Eucalyptus grandis TaxID=71139 RepID=A0A059DDS7_EUCGR|nr:hypothetical protein EUGRSUZ_A01087 [Eucalyptus grandis]
MTLHPIPNAPNSLSDETGNLSHRPPLRPDLAVIFDTAAGRPLRLRFIAAAAAAAADFLLTQFVLRGSFCRDSVLAAIGNSVLALPLLLLLRAGALPSVPEQPLLVRVDDLVYRLAVRRRVPARPEALVAPEAAALELRGVVLLAGEDGLLPVLAAGGARARRSVAAAVGARDEVGQDFPVLGRERRREGQDRRGEEGQLVGDGGRRRVDLAFLVVELGHGGWMRCGFLTGWVENLLCFLAERG